MAVSVKALMAAMIVACLFSFMLITLKALLVAYAWLAEERDLEWSISSARKIGGRSHYFVQG